jgi:hypothetical protein
LISSAAPQWLSSVQSNYDSDPIAQDLLSKLVLNSIAVPHFVLKDGVLRYKSRIWVGQDSALHRQLISALHDAPVGGHSGFPVTYSRVKRLFVWRGIKNDVKCFVLIESAIQVNSSPSLYHQGLGRSSPLTS